MPLPPLPAPPPPATRPTTSIKSQNNGVEEVLFLIKERKTIHQKDLHSIHHVEAGSKRELMGLGPKGTGWRGIKYKVREF